ncbi:MAG: methyltransferase domain-containing protein [Actinomycetota bacterium]|nr:class I SAM-dependent methyltransferase [Actinomycetota bacterium]
MPDTTLARTCVVCGSARSREELQLSAEWRVRRCESCGLRSLDPEPDPDQLVEVFDNGEIYEGAFLLREDIMARHAETLAALEFRVKPGHLLDVGCGPGFFLEAARVRGWQGTGVDPSPFSVRQIQSLGFEGHQGLLHEVDLPEASFDAVSLLQVVEHLVDPRELLEGCKRLLKPGGVLLVATPNPASLLARAQRERFNYWIPPVHCVWYTPRTLKAALANAGFKNVKTKTWSARAKTQHDGVAALLSTKLGRRLPARTHWRAAELLARTADATGFGSIVEATAIR